MQKNGSQGAAGRRNGPLIALLLLVVVLVGALLFMELRPYFTPQAPSAEAEGLDDVIGQYGDLQREVGQSKRRLERGDSTALLITQEAPKGEKVALTIDGMLEPVIMEQILDILDHYNKTATFFISGMQAAESPEVVQEIYRRGHEVGNYTLRGIAQMQELTMEELVEDFACSAMIITGVQGKQPRRLKCNATTYTDEVMRAAAASGAQTVVQSSSVLTYHSFASYEDVKAYMDKLPYQSIISIKLSGKLDPSEYTPKEIIEEPALDKQPDAEAVAQPEQVLTENERLLRMLRWLLQAMDETEFSAETETLRQRNDGKLAETVTHLYTTDPSVGYAFFGLERVSELAAVLESLKTIGGTGTFFVSAEEIDQYPEQIALILQHNQSLGLVYYPKKDEDYHSVCLKLMKGKEKLEASGYLGVRLVMQGWGEVQDTLREAVSAMDLTLVGYDQSFAREESQKALTAQEVIDILYKGNTYGFQRGRIIAFRMNYFERSGLLGELLLALEGTRNTYAIKDIYLISQDTEALFTYPLPREDILPEVKDAIHTGQGPADVITYAAEHYVGNVDVNTRNQFPGFSYEEMTQMDKRGRIGSEEAAVFLTFDDWGTDVGLNKILDVLRKHNVKATFYVRTQYVPDNPALLRTIALEGHEIGSHSDTHVPLAHDKLNNWVFSSLTPEEAAVLQADAVASYETLQSIIGDVRLDNGKPALSRTFRPPTLAISKIGMEAIFDCGFSHIVSGEYTSRDYNATSAEALFKEFRQNIRAGTVVVMHMSDNSIYTAEALDMFLTYNATRTDRKPYTFARVSDYLK